MKWYVRTRLVPNDRNPAPLSEAEKWLYWLTHLKEQQGLQEWLYLGDLIILLGMFLYSLAPLFSV